MLNKYKATSCYYSHLTGRISTSRLTRFDLRFDSRFEAQVYARLRELLPDSRIERQVRLLIKPETAINQPYYWRCDFRVYHPEDETNYWNIEAKGFLTRDFLRNLQYLELFSPTDWSQLVIVTNNSDLKVKNFTPLSLNQLEQFLLKVHFIKN